ncbi:hypothetical protein GCM10009527_053310 [Actinomadura nitritigenes]
MFATDVKVHGLPFEEGPREHAGAEFETVDIADYDLPVFDEPRSPLMGTTSIRIRGSGARR